MWTGVAHLQAAKLMQIYAERRLQEDKAMRDLVQQVAEGHMNSKTVKEKLRKMKQNIGALWHPTCCCCLLHTFNSLTLTPLSRFIFGSARGLGAKSRAPTCGTGGGPSRARQEISNHQGNPCSRIASSHSNQEFWRHRGGVEKEARSRSHYFFKLARLAANLGCRVSDCRTRPAGGDVAVWAEGAAGSPEGSTATGPAGETGENLKG